VVEVARVGPSRHKVEERSLVKVEGSHEDDSDGCMEVPSEGINKHTI
jgi:hypothetical protein